MSVEPEDFKSAFADHPAGVCIITADSGDGPFGLTASSVASVSLDPPSLLFSVTKARGAAGHVLDAPRFAVNMLHAGHSELAVQFAMPGGERFSDRQNWTYMDDGVPVLDDAHSVFVCSHYGRLPVGESTVVVGEVEDIVRRPQGIPMVYHQRRFHDLGKLL